MNHGEFTYMLGLTGLERPLCALCPVPRCQHAVFYDRLRQRNLCARCAVAKVTHANEGRIEAQRRALR